MNKYYIFTKEFLFESERSEFSSAQWGVEFFGKIIKSLNNSELPANSSAKRKYLIPWNYILFVTEDLSYN